VIEAVDEGSASPKLDRTKYVRPEKRPLCMVQTSDEEFVNKEERMERRSKLKRQRMKLKVPVFSTDHEQDRTGDSSVGGNKAWNTEGATSDVQVNEWDGLPVLSSSRNSKREKSDKDNSERAHSAADYQSVAASDQSSKIKTEVTEIPKDGNLEEIELFKRPKNDNFKEDRKPRIFSFKKSCSSSIVKRQSILNFLTLQEPIEIGDDKSEVHVECRDSDSLDCVIIDGLEDLKEPEFKDDESQSIEEEIDKLWYVSLYF
jgi:hypothetical protein